jgi:hypothetical protein
VVVVSLVVSNNTCVSPTAAPEGFDSAWIVVAAGADSVRLRYAMSLVTPVDWRVNTAASLEKFARCVYDCGAATAAPALLYDTSIRRARETSAAAGENDV